jgi:hypothetical protein
MYGFNSNYQACKKQGKYLSTSNACKKDIVQQQPTLLYQFYIFQQLNNINADNLH